VDISQLLTPVVPFIYNFAQTTPHYSPPEQVGHDDRLPSTQVRDAINADPVSIRELPRVEQWERDLDSFSFEERWDMLDERISSAQLKYAKFVARRNYLSR
jgi:hypothetical protein